MGRFEAKFGRAELTMVRYGNDPRDFLLKLCAEGLPSGFIAPLILQVYPHKTRKYQKSFVPGVKNLSFSYHDSNDSQYLIFVPNSC